jgi:hypothetical protein
MKQQLGQRTAQLEGRSSKLALGRLVECRLVWSVPGPQALELWLGQQSG